MLKPYFYRVNMWHGVQHWDVSDTQQSGLKHSGKVGLFSKDVLEGQPG